MEIFFIKLFSGSIKVGQVDLLQVFCFGTKVQGILEDIPTQNEARVIEWYFIYNFEGKSAKQLQLFACLITKSIKIVLVKIESYVVHLTKIYLPLHLVGALGIFF